MVNCACKTSLEAASILSLKAWSGGKKSSCVFSANIFSANGVIQTSDGRMKTNITPLSSGLSKVMQLRPVSYKWLNPKNGTAQEIGFIAQEVEKVVPEAVVHSHASAEQLAHAKANGKPIPETYKPATSNGVPDANAVEYENVRKDRNA